MTDDQKPTGICCENGMFGEEHDCRKQISSADSCICGEINARHCQVRQDQKPAPARIWTWDELSESQDFNHGNRFVREHAYLEKCEELETRVKPETYGLALKLADKYLNERDETLAKCKVLEHDWQASEAHLEMRIEQLEAAREELELLKVHYKERGMAMQETGDMVRSLYLPKLEAAQKEIAELKEKLAIPYCEVLEAERARVVELEKELAAAKETIQAVSKNNLDLGEKVAELRRVGKLRAGQSKIGISDIIKALDGVCAVNLAEPSPGDLKRLHDAYHTESTRSQELKAKCEELELALSYLPKVPTEPYQKMMAKKLLKYEAALDEIWGLPHDHIKEPAANIMAVIAEQALKGES